MCDECQNKVYVGPSEDVRMAVMVKGCGVVPHSLRGAMPGHESQRVPGREPHVG